MTSTRPRSTLSIRRLRAVFILAIVAGMAVFTVTMLALVDILSDRFGPQVRADLEWRALRGATELARSTDLGIALNDRAMVLQAFGAHSDSADVLAIVAVDASGEVVARHGEPVPAADLFARDPSTITADSGYLASWAPVQIEGAEIGKVAVVVSTARLTETRATLSTVSRTTLLAGGLIVVFGFLCIWFFTKAVATRDDQLNDHAANLERRVEERTRELDERNRGMRVVFDNVAQGFITIDTHGVMAPERSAIVDTWFGAPAPSANLVDLVEPHCGEFAAWLHVNLDMIRDGLLPLELCLDQMPSSFAANGRSFAVTYSPIMDGDTLSRLLVIISDVTEQRARERAERDQRELITAFQRIGRDRNAAEEFLDESNALIACVQAPADRVLHDRALHTLKGNCGMFGFERFAELCHAIEGELRESAEAGLTESQRTRLAEGWTHVVRTIRDLLGPEPHDIVELERSELQVLVERVRAGAPTSEVAETLASWGFEPVVCRFERFGQQASGLARRLGKGEIEIDISDGGIRLDATRWAAFWAAMVHAVRNAVDHGFEPPEERTRAGKGRPRLELAATRDDRELVITISDDGGGIDWEGVRARAARLGLRSETQRDLIAAIFTDGVSTREQATETSGRGVGLAALQAAVAVLGGTIDVSSRRGSGTTLAFRFPIRALAPRTTRPDARGYASAQLSAMPMSTSSGTDSL